MEEKPNPPNPFDNLGDRGKDETNFKGKTPLSEDELNEIKRLSSEGLGVNEIARQIKRSAATVSRAFRKLNLSKSIALLKAGKIVDQKINAAIDLRSIHDRAFDVIMSLNTGKKTKDEIMKSGWLILKACDAIRKDIALQLKIYEALYNAEEVANFQERIIKILGEVAPDARDRFYTEYQKIRPV